MNILLPIIAYLLGSISSAIVVAKLMRLPDPRKQGSNNPGATNMLRIGGKKAAVITLLGDVLKGVIAVVIAKSFNASSDVLALVSLAVFCGHLFPVFFKFEGGKGVATAIGVYLSLAPVSGLLFLGIWLVIALISKYSSFAALCAAALMPLIIYWDTQQIVYSWMALAIAILLCWRHRENIKRLLKGEESRISFGKKPDAP